MKTIESPLPDVDEMYQAVVDRDPAFDGVFYTCVRTTGIFCRPTCRARKPRFENVEFVATPDDAIRAGFRPCALCHPLDSAPSHPDWVEDLMEKIRGGNSRLTDDDLRASGVEPSRARRYFRQRFGVTFQGFQRSARLGAALSQLNSGRKSIFSAPDNGYESQSGFREAFIGQFGATPGRASGMAALPAMEIQTPLRPMIAAADASGICLLEFLDRRALFTEMRRLRERFGAAIVPGMNEHLEHLRSELQEYFAGTREKFEVPLNPRGTPFQRSVWDRLRQIPYGTTVSYAQIAREAGRPSAVRAVGRANGENSIAIVIPCHRVVKSDGSLCGYGGGVWRKRWLIQHESRHSTCGKPSG